MTVQTLIGDFWSKGEPKKGWEQGEHCYENDLIEGRGEL